MSLTLAGQPRIQERVWEEVDLQFEFEPPQPAAATALRGLEELQSVLGYGMSCSAINSIEMELLGRAGGLRIGRIEGLAPLDLLGEFKAPVTLGELVPVRLRSDLLGLRTDTLGLVHWQRCIGARWLAGLFLRERLPQKFLTHTWMDMRRELRFPTRMELQARLGREPGRRDVKVCDYSRSGCRIEVAMRPTSGTRVELYDGELLAVGTVRYIAPAAKAGIFSVGCEFQNNEGIRISRRAAALAEHGVETWNSAETWQGLGLQA